MCDDDTISSSVIHKKISPVIYELGAAIYCSQLFENKLLLLTSLLQGSDDKVSKSSFMSAMHKNSDFTLGQLAGDFKKKANLPDSYDNFIKQGVKKRNYISHGYVLSHSDDFLTKSGRDKIIEELRDLQQSFLDRSNQLDQLLDKALNIFGGSIQQLKNETESMFETI